MQLKSMLCLAAVGWYLAESDDKAIKHIMTFNTQNKNQVETAMKNARADEAARKRQGRAETVSMGGADCPTERVVQKPLQLENVKSSSSSSSTTGTRATRAPSASSSRSSASSRPAMSPPSSSSSPAARASPSAASRASRLGSRS